MARSIFRKLLSLGRGSKKKSAFSPGASMAGNVKLSRNLAVNLGMIRDALGNSMDSDKGVCHGPVPGGAGLHRRNN